MTRPGWAPRRPGATPSTPSSVCGPRAVQADAEPLANAIEASKKDPGTPNTDAADEQIAALSRRADACELLVARRRAELQQAVDEHGSGWIGMLELPLAEASVAWHQACDELLAQYERIAGIRALIAFTEGGRYFAPGGVMPHVGRLPEITADIAVGVLRRYARVEQQQGEHAAA